LAAREEDASVPRPSPFRFGIDVLLETRPAWLRSARIGLVCHPASVDRQLVHSADRLRDAVRSRLVALFGPQHGARGEKQDNMIESADYRDPHTGLPVFSLYGAVREPTDDMLRGIDVLVVDLQDVGTRVYTFASTLAACMRAAARTRCRIVVLDRPNPIGGLAVEGNVLRPECRSFVGEFPMPMRHGLTLGELARLFHEAFGIACELEVVPMRGWCRRHLWGDLGLPWVSPSPNMPSPLSALVYPGAVLFEGTNLSEGRGTTRPFECIGAPFIDPRRLVARLRRYGLPGVCLAPAYFEPTFHKWAGQLCGGIQWHVLDPARARPYRTALCLLREIVRLYPAWFAWRQPPYEYEFDRMPIDLLAGDTTTRAALERGRPIAQLERGWQAELRTFHTLRRQVLLYS
jgi:uncharacterized protein YbbC (DUF1343 family)